MKSEARPFNSELMLARSWFSAAFDVSVGVVERFPEVLGAPFAAGDIVP